MAYTKSKEQCKADNSRHDYNILLVIVLLLYTNILLFHFMSSNYAITGKEVVWKGWKIEQKNNYYSPLEWPSMCP